MNTKKTRLLSIVLLMLPLAAWSDNITFADANVKAICVQNWDTNGDGEISGAEAAAVTDLGTVFKDNTTITSFDELDYFTGLTSIGDEAFSSCRGLTSVTIPNSVTSIGNYAFDGCGGLTEVTIPNSVTSIGNYAFDGCSHLTEVTIPNSVTSIGNYAFSFCRNLTSVTIPNSVTSIGNYAFDECIGLTSVTIPNSVTTIGESAFRYCFGLTSVTIPNSVTTIGESAFRYCSGLTSVTIPNSVTSFEENAFSSCSGLISIKVENGNTKYDSRDNCNAIIETNTNTLITGCKNTVIPNSVTSIGNYAFDGCRGLTSVTIPNSVTSIGNYAFDGCRGLTSVTIPNSVTTIGKNAFSSCSGLTSVTIPNSVTNIGNYAFSSCSGLTSVTIPNSVTSIEENAFSSCSGLISIKVENGNTKYDSRDNCNAIIETNTNTLITGCKNTVIPNSVTSIGNYAFSSCSGLTSVTIPNSVTSIGRSAFNGCSGLTSITIPNSVTSIGIGAFQGCSGLTSVTVEMETPLTITGKTFSNRTNATLYVPAGCKAAYEAADYWKEFKEIVEASIEPTDISQLDNAIYVEPVETVLNCTYALNIKAKNDVTVAGLGFTLTVPEGFYLDTAGDGIFNKLDSQRASSSKFMVMTSQDGNAYTFNVMPTSTTAISGNDGTVLTVRLKNENAELGIHELKISDAIYSVRNDDNSYETLDVADVISTIDISDEMLGDVNGDNRMDLTDAIMIVNHSLNNTPSNFKMKVADVNGDGNIDLTDAIIVVNRSMGNSSHARQAFFMDFDPE